MVTEEAERITKSRGQVYCLQDEPGVYRVWMPNTKTPGLAISRAFGDYCMKDFGVISVPEVTQRNITSRDQFAILATDGVCLSLFPVPNFTSKHYFLKLVWQRLDFK